MTEKKCPICEKLVLSPIEKFNLFNNTRINLSKEINIFYCKDCKFYFQRNNDDEKDYNNFYENYSCYSSKKKERRISTPNFINSFFKNKDLKILDYGSGNFDVLVELKNEHKFTNLYFYEMSIKENNTPYHVFTGEPDIKFDLIIVSHVLEHVYNLKSFINNLINLLNSNGHIYFEVPNANKYIEHSTVPYLDTNFEHINHFNLYSISKVVGREVVNIQEDNFDDGFNYKIIRLLVNKNPIKELINVNEDNFPKYIEESNLKIANFNRNIYNLDKIGIFCCGQLFYLLFENTCLCKKDFILIDDNLENMNEMKVYKSSEIINFPEYTIVILASPHIENKLKKRILEINQNLKILLLSELVI